MRTSNTYSDLVVPSVTLLLESCFDITPDKACIPDAVDSWGPSHGLQANRLQVAPKAVHRAVYSGAGFPDLCPHCCVYFYHECAWERSSEGNGMYSHFQDIWFSVNMTLYWLKTRYRHRTLALYIKVIDQQILVIPEHAHYFQDLSTLTFWYQKMRQQALG